MYCQRTSTPADSRQTRINLIEDQMPSKRAHPGSPSISAPPVDNRRNVSHPPATFPPTQQGWGRWRTRARIKIKNAAARRPSERRLSTAGATVRVRRPGRPPE
ncbi:hypothetical protein Acsp02_94090 [Actinoplanes sp. NBRC 103695]|nr:hypothetical protein Acsp02_94090 [Actinoplanes sp. NBRC 103695]